LPLRAFRTSRTVVPIVALRVKHRAAAGGFGGGGGGQREMFRATCSQCGGVAEVPFQPRGDKPVYCRDCFSGRSTAR